MNSEGRIRELMEGQEPNPDEVLLRQHEAEVLQKLTQRERQMVYELAAQATNEYQPLTGNSLLKQAQKFLDKRSAKR